MPVCVSIAEQRLSLVVHTASIADALTNPVLDLGSNYTQISNEFLHLPQIHDCHLETKRGKGSRGLAEVMIKFLVVAVMMQSVRPSVASVP